MGGGGGCRGLAPPYKFFKSGIGGRSASSQHSLTLSGKKRTVGEIVEQLWTMYNS